MAIPASVRHDDAVEFEFECTGTLIEWRGPAPHVFLPLPVEVAETIAGSASILTYGWGCIPATARAGDVTWTTSLFPRNGGYLLPIKIAARQPLGWEVGSQVTVTLRVGDT